MGTINKYSSKIQKSKFIFLALTLIFALIFQIIVFGSSSLAGDRQKVITKTVLKDIDEFEDRITYNEDGLSGILKKDGDFTREVISGYYVPGETKKLDNYEHYFGSSKPAKTYEYNKNGYTGTLNLMNEKNDRYEEDYPTYEIITKTMLFEKQKDNTHTEVYSADGKLLYEKYSWGDSSNHPTYHIDEDGYEGDIPKVDWETIENDIRTDNADGTYKIESTFRGYYEGELTKEVEEIEHHYVMEDHYTGYYSGEITKPTVDTRVWKYKQNYKGAVCTKALKEQNYSKNKNCENVGEPVNIITGNYYASSTDITINGLGLPLQIKRYYNSLDQETSVIGKGWKLNYDSNLTVDNEGKVKITYPDGSKVTYEPISGTRRYTSTETVFDQLTSNTDNTYTLTLKDRQVYKYNKDGKLSSITDQNGNTTVVGYDETGNMSAITEAGGKTLKVTTEGGKISLITDTQGRTVTYTYDTDGMLKQVKSLGGGITNYTYNNYGITSITDQNSKTYIKNEYDEFGRVIKQEDSEGNITTYTYDEAKLENTFTVVATGKTIKYEYNDKMYITKKTYSDDTYEEYTYDEYGNRDSMTDRNGNTTHYTYDKRGNLLSVKTPSPISSITNYTYDSNDNLTKVETPEGSITIFEYDSNNNLTKIKVKIDQTTYAETTYTYDTKGRLLTLTDPENNKTTYEYTRNISLPTKIIDPEQNVITYLYDTLNRKKAITTAYGTTMLHYNNLNKIEKIVDPEGNTTRMKYDAQGNLIKLIKPEQYNQSIDDGEGYSYEYDSMDRLIKQIDPLSNTSLIKYDAEGNKIKEVEPSNYNNEAGTVFQYDGSGRLTKIISPLGYKTKVEYDPAGNMTKIITPNNYSSSSDDGKGLEYYYDEEDKLIQIKDTEGNTTQKLIYDKDGRVIKQIDAQGYLSENTDNDRCGTLYKYNLAGWLVEKRTPLIKEKSGTIKYNITQYTYDKTGKLLQEKKSKEYVTKTEQPSELNIITYSYDKNGRVKTISDTAGAEIQYNYDALGNTIQQKIKIDDEQYKITGYEYDLLGRLIKTWNQIEKDDLIKGGTGTVNTETSYEYDKNGNITKIITPEGYETSFEYDNAGRLIAKHEQVTVDELDQNIVTAKINSIGKTVYPNMQYNYQIQIESDEEINDLGMQVNYDPRMVEIVNVDSVEAGITINTSELGQIMITAQNQSYTGKRTLVNLIVKTKDDVKVQGWITIDPTSTYGDNEGKYLFTRLSGISLNLKEPDMNNDGQVKANDLTLVALKKGVQQNSEKYNQIHDINANGIVDTPDLDYITDWIFTEPQKTLTQLTAHQCSQIATNAVYSKTTNIKKRTTKYKYDKTGNIIKETDCDGNTIIYEYDEQNRLTKVTDKLGNITKLEYDKQGNITKKILPQNYNQVTDSGKGITYVYDSMGRLITVTDAKDIIQQKNIYNEQGQLIKQIDAEGYLSASTDEKRDGIEYTYDIGGRITSISTPMAVQNNKKSQSYTYDALDNIITSTDGQGNTTTYETDMWGKITKVIDPKGVETNYTYNHMGSVTSSEDGNGNTKRYTYNSIGLLKKEIDAEGEAVTYKYDRQERQVQKTDRNGETISYTYNSDNNLTERSTKQITEQYMYNLNGTLLAAANENIIHTYEYTDNGQLETQITNGIQDLSYEYNKNGQITSIINAQHQTVDYTYDIEGRLYQILDEGAQIAKYEYNPDNTVKEIEYTKAQITTNYTYDKDKNILSITAENGQNQIIKSLRYTYDNNGNTLTKTENGQTTTYEYDALNRLKTVDYPELGIERFTYDNAGNRKSRTIGDTTVEYTYDTLNRLTQSTKNGIITAYKYDGNGNTIKQTTNGEITTNKYDALNRLKEVQNPNGTYMKNIYDAVGLRIAVIENGLYTEFTYDRGQIISETGIEESSYIRGYNLIAKKDKTQELSYYINDAHHDVEMITDKEGNILNSYKYDAFGNITQSQEKIHNRFKYSGEQYDSITQQYYLRARFYNPVIGRFTQEDTYRGDGLNLYAYVSNNPIKYIDPSGYCKDDVDEDDLEELLERIYRDVNNDSSIKRDEGFRGNAYYWDKEFNANIKPLIDGIPSSLSDVERKILIDTIINLEADKLQKVYKVTWQNLELYSPTDKLYKKLNELYTSYNVEEYIEEDSTVKSLFRSMLVSTVYSLGTVATTTGQDMGRVSNEGMGKLDELAPKDLSKLTPEQLKKGLPDGWTYSGSPDGRFVHIKDGNGNYRVRIDPPDKVTDYPHMHILDGEGNAIDINGNIVPANSPDAHIPR